MKSQLLHTPEGVRDIYKKECRKKIALQEKLHETLHLYGYADIQTPTFEYFDVFCKEIGTISPKELYKFFDRDGNTLVLRPDMTPSISRAVFTMFETEQFPIRLCYMGNTFVNHSSYEGRLKENTQIGGELIGIDSISADGEMLALVVDGLKRVGLKEFQLNVGHVDFFQSLIEEAELEEELELEVRELIINRNYFGVEELLQKTETKKEIQEAFHKLPELVGGVEVLIEAKKIAPNQKCLNSIKRLREIYEVLKIYGVEQYITFDLSMSGAYGYYTGIIFRGYTYGTGDAIVKGGRYDNLMEKFGRKAPSIGFGIVVDELMNALSRQKIRIPYKGIDTLVLHCVGEEGRAISIATLLREKGKNTEVKLRDDNISIYEYKEMCKSNGAFYIIYVKPDTNLIMIDVETSDEQVIL